MRPRRRDYRFGSCALCIYYAVNRKHIDRSVSQYGQAGEKMEETYAAKREEMERAAEAKFNIDVDLGPASEQVSELPADIPKPAIQELLEAEKARAEQEIREAKAARKQRSKKMQE